MASTQSAAAAAPKKPRSYKDFMTPLLHRRFTGAARWTICACFVESLWMSLGGNGSWLYFVFMTLVRTLMLFIPALMVYLLRVGGIHVGARKTASDFDGFKRYAFRFSHIHTIFWYMLSAFVFCEVYIWSADASKRLQWIDQGRVYERPRLNERPVFLRSLFVILGLGQSLIHLYKDHDRVRIGQSDIDPIFMKQSSHPPPPPKDRILTKTRAVFLQSLTVVMFATLGGIILYWNFLASIRQFAWDAHFAIAKRFFYLPKVSRPGKVTGLAGLVGIFLLEGYLLVVLWSLTNLVFSEYFAEEPLKRGRPITDDSKDPNGSLITGLKSKKDLLRNVAFRELVLITRKFEARRKSIFGEIDRKPATTFNQILQLCLDETNGIKTRMTGPAKPAVEETAQKAKPELKTLPKISKPLLQDNIFVSEPAPTSHMGVAGETLGSFARLHGSAGVGSPIPPLSRKLLEASKNKMLTPEQQRQLRKDNVVGIGRNLFLRFLRTPPGAIFRQTFARRASTVIFGEPYAQLSIIVNAVEALTRLCESSLKEDQYGKVFYQVPSVMRCFYNTATVIEAYVRDLDVHWTDTEFKDEDRHVQEIDDLVVHLKKALKKLLVAFGEYLSSMDMTQKEIREMRELTGTVTMPKEQGEEEKA